MPEISVIVPVYKVEPYLHQCVDSILNQTFRDFEVILVDDGSPDGCPAICDEYAKRDSRVRVIHKKNGGLSSARNAGIDASRGNYLSFVDSDDWIDPEMLQKMHTIANNGHADIVICDTEVYEDDGKTCKIIEAERGIENGIYNRQQMTERLASQYWGYIISCNKLFRRTLFGNIRYPEGYINEDAAIIHRLVGKSGLCAITTEKLYCYRQRKNSITHSEHSPRETDILTALADRVQFSAQNHWEKLYTVTTTRYVYTFFDLYFRFPRTKDNEKYFIRMENSLKTALPYIRKCKQVSKRHKLYLTLIRWNPRLYLWLKNRKDHSK